MLLAPWQRQKKPLIVEVVDNDVPQECVSKANVEQVDKAETQKPQQHHSTPAQQVVEQIIAVPAGSEQNEGVLRNVEPDHDETVPQCVEAEVPTVIYSPTEPQESVQECTDEQAADVPPLECLMVTRSQCSNALESKLSKRLPKSLTPKIHQCSNVLMNQLSAWKTCSHALSRELSAFSVCWSWTKLHSTSRCRVVTLRRAQGPLARAVRLELGKSRDRERGPTSLRTSARDRPRPRIDRDSELVRARHRS